MDETLLLNKLHNSHGGSLVAISNYLINSADDNYTVFKQVKDMVADLKISKVTIISFLQFLETHNFIVKVKRGVIRIHPQFIKAIQHFKFC